MKLIKFVEMRLVISRKNTVYQSILYKPYKPFYNVSGFFKMLTLFDPLILCLGHYAEIVIRCEEKLHTVDSISCQCMVYLCCFYILEYYA